MDLGLKGKVAVVTGGSEGIGRAIALGLAAEGVDVAVCARREGPLRDAEAAIRSTGVGVHAAICDVADPVALDAFLDAAKVRFGRIDILVNNASGFGLTDDEPGWKASLDVDLLAAVRASRKVIPWMAAQGAGNLQFISSISGLASGSAPAYAAAKAAIISYASTIAASLAPRGIRANTIAPGSIEFAGGRWARVSVENSPRYESIRASIPWGRLGTPEEVADVAVFLASDRSRWITGECICVDGGQYKGNR